jgi:hypothetical protein
LIKKYFNPKIESTNYKKTKKMLYAEIELYQNTKKFLFLPKNHPVTKTPISTQYEYSDSFEIDRTTGKFEKIKITEETEDTIFKPYKTMTLIYGILGTIELLSGTYLIIILKKEFKGYIKQHKIYRIKKIQAIPFSISKFYKLDEAMVTYYL